MGASFSASVVEGDVAASRPSRDGSGQLMCSVSACSWPGAGDCIASSSAQRVNCPEW